MANPSHRCLWFGWSLGADPELGQPRGCFTPLADSSLALSRNLNRTMGSPDPIGAIEAALLIGEAVRRINLANGALDLASLARDLGLGIRQPERRFSQPLVSCRRFIAIDLRKSSA